ncbi:MAG: trans-sulfuration enzyme family protein [Beduini sp.]
MEDELMILTHFGENLNEYKNAITPPIFMNSLHTFNNITEYYKKETRASDQYFYGRVDNPTSVIAERKIAALENGKHALIFSSGMAAATTALQSILKAGSHIICVKNAYSVLVSFIEEYLVSKMNMSVTYVEGQNTDEIIQAINDNTDLIILESPVSLTFNVQDIRAITSIAKSKNIKTYIDNSYCTPLFQKPLDMGVDVVMHTASKYLGGHSDLIGGALVTNDTQLFNTIHSMREMCGGILGPQEAFLLIRGMRTLEIRVKAHAKTALEVANFLEQDTRIDKVYYPGLKSHPQYELIQKQQSGSTGLLSFELKTTSEEKIVQFVDSLKVFKIGVSWGGFESLVCTPLLMHSDKEASKAGCKRGIIRIHCGLEGSENLINDLKQALDQMED